MSEIPPYVNIKDNDSLVRDTFSMGVINLNTHALEASKRRHQLALMKLAEERQKEMEVRQQEKELNTLRTEVAELKKLVKKLVEEK